MNSKQRVLAALDHREPDRVPLGEWGIDHDTAERILGRKTFHRARARSTLAIWAGRGDEVRRGINEDLVELMEKLDHDLVPVGWNRPGDFNAPNIKEIDAHTWQDDKGRIYKYSEGNDAILCVDPGPSQPIRSKDELIEYCETEYFPDAGFRVARWASDGCELEADDERGLDMTNYVSASYLRGASASSTSPCAAIGNTSSRHSPSTRNWRASLFESGPAWTWPWRAN